MYTRREVIVAKITACILCMPHICLRAYMCMYMYMNEQLLRTLLPYIYKMYKLIQVSFTYM